jgi:hypothetical protein
VRWRRRRQGRRRCVNARRRSRSTR